MIPHDTVYLSWQSDQTRAWHVVGKLSMKDGNYVFQYTAGAERADHFIPFSGMEDLYVTYKSSDLFPLFQNRILSCRRPEYPRFIQWLGLSEGKDSALEILSRSEGIRNTDRLQTFKRIMPDSSGQFIHYFFVHGLRHVPLETQLRVNQLKTGAKLYLAYDLQNEYDHHALLLRTENPLEIIGYSPRYLSADLNKRLQQDPRSITVTLHRLQADAPLHYRALCKISGSAIAQSSEQEEFDEYKVIANH